MRACTCVVASDTATCAVTPAPVMLKVPVNALALLFVPHGVSTINPLPVPLAGPAPAATVAASQLVAQDVDVTLQLQVEGALIVMFCRSPSGEKTMVLGVAVSPAHNEDAAACDTATVAKPPLPVMVSVPVKSTAVMFGPSGVRVIEPPPVPLIGAVFNQPEAVLLMLQAHVEPAITLIVTATLPSLGKLAAFCETDKPAQDGAVPLGMVIRPVEV